MKKKILLGLVVIVAIAMIAIVYKAGRFLSTRPSNSPDTVIFEVEPRTSFKHIAHTLEEQSLITNAGAFELLARYTGSAGKVRTGEYALRKNMTPREVLQIITSGKSIEYTFTVQEGLNIYEIAEQLEKQGLGKKSEFLSLCKDPAVIKEFLGEEESSLEGYLFPETYHVTRFTGARGLIRIMVARFLDNYKKIETPSDVKMTRHQIVTLASIVEKETGAPDERPIVSSVFHNRLRLGMKLQTDPTIIYGILSEKGKFGGNITHQDLIRPTLYNTYVIAGLPPGPISNPGLDAMKATVHPAKTEFLFFVSRNDGTHVYSKEYAQHLRAVGKFQLDPKAREGKSWRDLKKKTKPGL
jgi:UPF0755 protein